MRGILGLHITDFLHSLRSGVCVKQFALGSGLLFPATGHKGHQTQAETHHGVGFGFRDHGDVAFALTIRKCLDVEANAESAVVHGAQ